jgi:haloalkane dehalogenase
VSSDKSGGGRFGGPTTLNRKHVLRLMGAATLAGLAPSRQALAETAIAPQTRTALASGVLRTPDTAFAGLEGYPYAPNYRSVRHPALGELALHYLDVGPRDASPVVLLHGQPSWSYLYRKVIVRLLAAGHRVIAPDMIGYGRSDKPAARSDYSYQLHLDWLTEFLSGLGGNLTLVVHDWGGLLGLRIAAENPGLFVRLVVLDTSLNDGTDRESPQFTAGFDRWLKILEHAPELRFSAVIEAQTETTLTPGALAGYDAPFPDRSYQTGARVMSSFIPRTPDMAQARENGLARARLRDWQTPVLIAFSEGSARTHPGQHALLSGLFPASRIWRDATIAGAHHFLPEDRGEDVGDLIATFCAAT